MSDRSVTLDGEPVTLGGRGVDVGEKAPGFRVLSDLGESVEFESGQVGDSVHILTTALSIDTPVCANQFRAFDDRAESLKEEGIEVWYITRDLPFALQRNAEEMGVEHVRFLSDYKDGAFGDAYGVDVEEFGLLARATFVVDEEGELVYREICSEIGEEPDYDAAVEAARKAKRDRE